MNALDLALRLSRQYSRSPLLVGLFLVVPLLFISLSYYTTENTGLAFFVRDDGERRVMVQPMPDVHGAIMVPITGAFLGGMAGLFAMLDSRRTDERLIIAGVPAASVAAARLLLIGGMAVGVAVVAVAVDLASFRPAHLAGFLGATALVAATYGFLGALVVLVVGRLGGAYLMLFLPMIDVGIFQDPMMVSGEPDWWMKLLPGFGGTRLTLDAAFSSSLDDWVAAGAGIAWLLALALLSAVAVVARRSG